MSADEVRSEKREVSDFDRVALTGFGELIITQGDEEALTIEASQHYLDRIETEVRDGKLAIAFSHSWFDWIGDVLNLGFAGLKVKYELSVKQLNGIEILGAGRVRSASVSTDSLSIGLRGAGEISIEGLDADMLKVDLPGAGRIHLAGRVAEQTFYLSGAGSYDAPKLESQKAKATLVGLGSATVWAVEELDATIRGVGSVSYYGSPTVRKEITGPGSVRSLGSR